MPKLSVITINLNNATGLHKTIESVVNQTFRDFEYIIIDGSSKDGSLDIIKEYKTKLSFWVSEPDNGIYNAMNKGIKVATGEYCLFLNSGDYLLDSTILENCLSHTFTEDIVYGNQIQDRHGKLVTYKLPSNLTFYTFYIDSLAHPCTFIKTKLFEEISFYNEKYKIVSDWEFFLKAIFFNNATLRYIDKEIAVVNWNGISMNSGDLCKKERSLVLMELFPKFIDDYEQLFRYRFKYTVINTRNKYIRFIVKGINKFIDAE